MRNYNLVLICFVNIFCVVAEPDLNRNVTCGLDFSGIGPVYEGLGQIETYPWLGILFYPLGKSRATSVVVLVTKQLVIASAAEIDSVPKHHFRERSRVVLGTNCTGPAVRVRDYTYHPEFAAETYSALALLQLEMDDVEFGIHPICGPPSHFVDMRIYALTLNEDCENPVVTIHEMKYVDLSECKQFYRRSGLDVSSLWPTRATCARALSGNECVWRGGAALATKFGERWHLLGFGIYGPGCNAPARFMDYGLYRQWVKTSVARIGKPAITRVSPSQIIMRRSLSNIQRYGPCDIEEVKRELYTDTVSFKEDAINMRVFRYNISIYDSVEYSCVVLRVYHKFNKKSQSPMLRLRRWCSKPTGLCSGFQFIQIDFYVEIEFKSPIVFKFAAYGKEAKIIDPRVAMKYVNRKKAYPLLPRAGPNNEELRGFLKNRALFWINK